MRILVASVEPFASWSYAWSRGGPGTTPGAGAPALVCSENERTVAYANEPARAAGVTVGMSLAGARGRVPDLTILPIAGPEVDAAWDAFLDDMHAVSPRVAGVRTGVAAFTGDAHDAAAFGERTGARVGGAGSVEEAHLLAYTAEPGHAVLAGADRDPWTRLDAAPIYLLGGVGLSAADRRRLAWLGVDTIGRLRSWTPAQLTAFLGEGGATLRPYLHGPRTSRLPLRLPPTTVRTRHAFEDPVREPHQIDPVLERLLARAVHALDDRSAGRVRVVATADGIASDATRRAKTPLRDPRKLLNLARLALTDTRLVPFGLSELQLELSGLVRVADALSLWPQARRRAQAAHAVHDRFPGQARRFAEHDPDALRPRLRWRLLDATSDEEVRLPEEVPAATPTHAAADPGEATRPATRRVRDHDAHVVA